MYTGQVLDIELYVEQHLAVDSCLLTKQNILKAGNSAYKSISDSSLDKLDLSLKWQTSAGVSCLLPFGHMLPAGTACSALFTQSVTRCSLRTVHLQAPSVCMPGPHTLRALSPSAPTCTLFPLPHLLSSFLLVRSHLFFFFRENIFLY